MKSQNKKILFLSVFLVIVICIFFYARQTVSEAQAPKCVQYAPMVMPVGRATESSGTRDWCVTEKDKIANFGAPIGPTPTIALLKNFHMRYTGGGDHHVHNHGIAITSNCGIQGCSPVLCCGNQGAKFDVTICYGGGNSIVNSDEEWKYRYEYEVAAWPLP